MINNYIFYYIKKEIIAIIKSIISLTLTFTSASLFFLYIVRFVLYNHSIKIFIIAVMSFTLFVVSISLLIMQQIYTIPKEDTRVNQFFRTIIKAIDIARYSSIFLTAIYSILKLLEWGDKFIANLP